jgi:hypothetical protein
MTRLLGIYREPECSPGRHARNDAVILRLVGHELERAGAEVTLATLAEARHRWNDASAIFSMCQGPEALSELADWADRGAVIVNDPTASRRTHRDQLCPLLGHDGLPFPRSVFAPTGDRIDLAELSRMLPGGVVWIKRAGVHATCVGDVVRVDGWDRAESALDQFRLRGLDAIVLQQHCPGDEVKFYGVGGRRFFWSFYSGEPAGYPFDLTALRKFAETAADLVGVAVYGGDAIIGPDGSISIIDLNDWPSFAPCREAAAVPIARCILEQAAHSS